MYEKYCALRDAKGVKDAHVAKETGIGQSTFTDWKNRRSVPKQDKLQRIADYFDVPLEYFTSDDETNVPYYLDDDARELAQFAFYNPDYKILFKASRNVKPENIQLVLDLMNKMS